MKFHIPISILGSVLLLSGCASTAPLNRAQSYEGRPEKALLAVLRNVEADDTQRTAILAVYDRHNPLLTRLAEDWDRIDREWAALDRRAPDFGDKAAALSQRRVEVAGQQLIEGAAFERDVAALLTPEQWSDWQDLWELTGMPESCGPGGPVRRRR